MRIFEKHTDSELLALARTNVQGAFKEIYDRYAPKLFRYAHARINSREDCKELVNEVFESLWKSEKEIKVLSAFLYTILKFRIINFYEHKAVRKRFSTYMEWIGPETHSTEEESEIENLRSLINKSLKSLPARCQDAVRLRIDRELSLDEIAKQMNVNNGTVKQYLTIAMRYFRKVHTPIYRIK